MCGGPPRSPADTVALPPADSCHHSLPIAAACPPAAASGVHWKAGKDVTVKVMKKKAKPGEWGGAVGWCGWQVDPGLRA